MSIPLKIKPHKINDYFEVMSKAVLQAGLSWAAIDKRWTSFRLVFAEFDPKKVARFSDKQIKLILEDHLILINQKKLDATIHNAQILVSLDKEYAGFANYLSVFDSYEKLALDLKKRFKYLGDLNVYYFLFRVGEPVPPFQKWIKSIKGNHPRMKEMIEAEKTKNHTGLGDAINNHRRGD